MQLGLSTPGLTNQALANMSLLNGGGLQFSPNFIACPPADPSYVDPRDTPAPFSSNYAIMPVNPGTSVSQQKEWILTPVNLLSGGASPTLPALANSRGNTMLASQNNMLIAIATLAALIWWRTS